MNIKFTDDGKKVAVLGKLNSTESIVQEIFIINDQEIPSGDNFVVKGLHDAPAISWKEKQLKELEEKYNSKKLSIESSLESIEKNYQAKKTVLGEKIAWSAEAIRKIDPDTFQRIYDLMTGQINFIVAESYYGLEIQLFDEEIKTFSSYGHRVEAIKMLTIYGDPDKGLHYKLNQYKDGSGSNTKIQVFKTEDEAYKYVNSWVNSDQPITEYRIKTAIRYNIEIDKHLLDAYKKTTAEAFEKQVQDAETTLEWTKEKLTIFKQNPFSHLIGKK